MLISVGNAPTEEEHLEELAYLDQRLRGELPQDANTKLPRTVVLVSQRFTGQLTEILYRKLGAIVESVEPTDKIGHGFVRQFKQAEGGNFDSHQSSLGVSSK